MSNSSQAVTARPATNRLHALRTASKASPCVTASEEMEKSVCPCLLKSRMAGPVACSEWVIRIALPTSDWNRVAKAASSSGTSGGMSLWSSAAATAVAPVAPMRSVKYR